MKSNKTKQWLLVLVGVLVIGGGSFYGGMQYGQRHFATNRLGRLGGINGNRSGLAAGSSFANANGEVIAQDDKSVTIKLAAGGSQIIFLSDSTQITKSANGVIGDLTAGTQVSASGSKNADGSLSATSVQIRPAGMTNPGQIPPMSVSN